MSFFCCQLLWKCENMKRDILQSQIFAADWLGTNWEIGKMYLPFKVG